MSRLSPGLRWVHWIEAGPSGIWICSNGPRPWWASLANLLGQCLGNGSIPFSCAGQVEDPGTSSFPWPPRTIREANQHGIDLAIIP